MLDWNWFYTGLAQSAAAIVGFFGGFVISKVITRDGEYRRLNEQALALQTRILEQKRKLTHRYFHWYNKRTRETVRKGELYSQLVGNGTGSPDYVAIISELKYSPYDSFEEITKEIDQDWGTKKPPSILNIPVSPNLGIINAQVGNQIQEERELIDRELVATEALTGTVRNHLAEMVSFPRGSRITKLTLLLVSLLFLAGVIYPLSFTPTYGEPVLAPFANQLRAFWDNLLTLKGILLFVVTLVFLVIVIIFWFLEANHHFPIQLIKELRNSTALSEYSPYLANYERRSGE